MLYLLHGADTFRSAARLRDLRAALDPTGFNGTSLDGQETTFGGLRAACDALPFFGGGRCVDVRGLLARWKEPARRGTGQDAEKAKGDGDPFAALADYLPKLPPTTTLLLWEPAAIELPAPLRAAVEGLGVGAVVERFDVPFGRELHAWVSDHARDIGTAIRPDAAEALLDALCPHGWREVPRRRDALHPDLQRIATELEKLATAILGRESNVITARDVAALTTGEAETDIFQLVNAAAAGDARRALALLRKALDDGIVPEQVLSLLGARFGLLTRVVAVGGARAAETSAGKLGIPGWQARQAAQQLNQLGAARVPACLRIVLDAEEAIKTGRAPQSDDALYWAVLELCRVGEAVPLLPARGV